MRGDYPTIQDITLESLVLPANLLSNESLSPEDEPEEEQLFRVDTLCYFCKVRLRVCVRASEQAIRSLQVLLFRELQFLCPTCARNYSRHGGSH
ncbi:E7 [Human papillomavirus KC5]|uniref:E7 n=1 Tax=Human papillomavirus KC5 TaxID=1647924 RepID=UPI000290C6E0|nr:E7 [Human papillomavirus KC5]AFV27141.1 E7 [Human papillomavirus KC5]